MGPEGWEGVLDRAFSRARRLEEAGAWLEAAELYAWLLERFPEEARRLGCLEAQQRCQIALQVEELWIETEQGVAAGDLERARNALREILRLQPDAARGSRSARDWIKALEQQSAARQTRRMAWIFAVLLGITLAGCGGGIFLAFRIMQATPAYRGTRSPASEPLPSPAVSPTRPSAGLLIPSPVSSPTAMPDHPLSVAPERIRPIAQWGSRAIPVGILMSPDGQRIAWLVGNTVEWLDPVSLRTAERTMLSEHAPITAGAFSPDGQWLALGTESGEIVIWSIREGRILRTLKSGLVESLAFSPDGFRLAAGAVGGRIRVWRLPEGALNQTLELEASRVFDLSFLPSGDRLIAATSDGQAHLLDLTTGRKIRSVAVGGSWATALAVHPNGQMAAVGGTGGQILIWRITDGMIVQTLKGHQGTVTTLAFAPDGAALVSGGTDRTVRRWGLPEGRQSFTLLHPVAWVDRVVILPDGRLGASFSDGTVMTIDPRRSEGEEIETTRRLEASMHVRALAFSPDGRHLAAGYADGAIRLWSVREQRLLREWGGHAFWIGGLAFDPGGGWLASAGADGWVRRWAIPEGQLVQEAKGDEGWLSNVVVIPDGAWMAAGGIEHRVYLFPTDPGAVRVLEGDHRRLPFRTLHDWDYQSVLTVNRTGEWLASYGISIERDGRVRHVIFLWRIPEGRLVAEFDLPAWDVPALAFSPDGQWLAIGVGSHLQLLSLPDRKPVLDLNPRLSGGVQSVAFTPDGRLMFAGGTGEIAVIRTTDGATVGRLEGHSDVVNAIAVSPDGILLASGSEDGTIILWGIR